MSFENWDFTCADWVDRLKTGRTPIAELPLNKVYADAAVGYFDKLCIPDVAGQPLMKDAGGEWFRDIIRAAFGSVDFLTGQRAIDEIFILVPKKNSKTTNSAALGLVALLMNDTPNIEGIIVGPTQTIADTCFRQAVGMIEADEYLSRRFHVDANKYVITDLSKDPISGRPKKAKLKIKSFSTKVVTGTIPAFAIIDELHVMAEFKDADRVLGQITGGGITAQPTFVVYITTQSEREPTGVFKQNLDYARSVRDGTAEGQVKMLPVIYEFPEEMQRDEKRPWLNPDLWSWVLPNMGRSVYIEKLIPKFEQAKAKGPVELARWASQHLNLQVGIATHIGGWIGANYWLQCEEPGLTLKDILDRSEVAVVGFDNGGLDDLAGLAVFGRDRETRNWLGWFRAWAQSDVFERRQELQQKLLDFEAAGDLVVVPDEDPLSCFREVTEICCEIRDRDLFPESGAIGLDPNLVTDLVAMLKAKEFTAGSPSSQIVGIAQGWKLASSIWGWELRLKMKTFLHCGQPMMNWCLGNAKAELRGKNIAIEKSRAGPAKIDPLVAGFNAFELMARNPKADVRGSMFLEIEGVCV